MATESHQEPSIRPTLGVLSMLQIAVSPESEKAD